MTEAARGHLAMLAFSALVAGSFSLGGMAAPHIDPAALNAVRFTLAAVAMWALAAARRSIPRTMFAAPWRYVVVAVPFTAYFVTMFEALRIASPVSLSAVFTLTPAMAALFGWAILSQVTTRRTAAAIAMGGAGALWVIFDGSPGALVAFDVGRGEAIFFLGVVGHALYAPLLRRFSRGEPPAAQTAAVLTIGAAMLAAWSGPRLFATPWLALPDIVWITILYTAVAATALSFSIVRYASYRLPAGKLMAYTYLTPSWVILWEIALGQGVPPAWILPGIGLTALALVLLLRRDGVAASA